MWPIEHLVGWVDWFHLTCEQTTIQRVWCECSPMWVGLEFFPEVNTQCALCRCFWYVLGLKVTFFEEKGRKQTTKQVWGHNILKMPKIMVITVRRSCKTKTFAPSLQHCAASFASKGPKSCRVWWITLIIECTKASCITVTARNLPDTSTLNTGNPGRKLTPSLKYWLTFCN